MARLAYLSDEDYQTIQLWHGGQFTAVYSVMSRQGGTPAELRDAADELELDYNKLKAKKRKTKQEKNALDELGGLIDSLRYMADYPEEYYSYNPPRRVKINKKIAEDWFKAEALPLIRDEYEQDGRRDLPARRKAWNNFTDYLQKEGLITMHQYETWIHPACCK